MKTNYMTEDSLMAKDQGSSRDLNTELDSEIQLVESKIQSLRERIRPELAYLELLERQLDSLKTLRSGEIGPRKFENTGVGIAAQAYLRETHAAITRDELVDVLVREGCGSDTSRPVQAVGAGVSQLLRMGTLVERDGKVWLPEWTEGQTIKAAD